MGQSLTSFVTPVDQEKYYVFLICSQEKHLHFQEKARKGQEKISGRICMNPFCISGQKAVYGMLISKTW